MAHVLVGKPVPTFPGHALSPRAAAATSIAPRTPGRLRRIACAAGVSQLARERIECRNAILGRGMGREQVVHALPTERIDDEEMRSRGIALGGVVLDVMRGVRDLH